MGFAFFLMILGLMLIISAPIYSIVSSTEWYYGVKARSKGGRRIYCRSSGKKDGWYCWAFADPFGDMIAYRHKYDIGFISLKSDGTGYYHGNIEWIDAP